jgi:NAD dependent epimerase/dehydratase family enzyme
MPAPGFAVKLALGEMGQRLLLEGQKVLPRRLQDSHYQFLYPELAGALSDVLTSDK